MTADNPRATTLPDVNPTTNRTLRVTPHPYFTPDNSIVTSIYLDRVTGEPTYYPVEVNRKDLLAALDAEPDETDYREVVEENNRLGRKLAEAISARDAAERERDDAAEALRDAAEAPEEPQPDPAQIDRSWALERAAEVLSGLAAVGALPKDWAGVPVIGVAEWILNGKPVDRG